MKLVKSSNIAAIGHEGDTLTVELKNGQKWRYAGVSKAQHDNLISDPSIGGHFAKHIRSRHKGEKVV